MHVKDDDLKALIDCVAMRLDDELDTLGEDLDVRRVLDDRDDVRIIWSLTDLLENLRQEQRSRTRARRQASRDDSALADNSRLERAEALIAEHEEDRMALRAELGAVQATIGDLLAQSNDHAERLTLLKARDPDVMFWGRIRNFERKMEKWAREVGEVLDARTDNGRLSAEALLRLTGMVEGLQEKLQALELQSDDRWVRVQQGDNLLGVRLGELENLLETHVGETGTRH